MKPGRPADPALSAALSARAVDLSALKSRSEPAQPGPGSPPGSPNGAAPATAHVLDVTEETFQAEVLDRSYQVPVVLDLWADWCGPCKQLSPVLERLATEGGGSWILAKIDVDANPNIAQALRVQGIPAVKAVFQGQLIGEFTGALPESQVRQFVSALMEATGGAGADGSAGPAGLAEPETDDPRVVAAEEAVARGDLDDAVRRYRAILAAEPAHPRAAEALREVELLRRVEATPADAVARADAAPHDVEAQLAAADAELADGRVEAAFGRVLAAIGRSDGADRDTARARLVELFAIVGDADPRVAAARRQLTSLLF